MTTESTKNKIIQNMDLIRLQDEYKTELKNYHIYRTLVAVMKQCRFEKDAEIGAESQMNIQRAQDYLKVMDYAKIENAGYSILGLSNKPTDLSYTERKAWRNRVTDILMKTVMRPLNFIRSVDQSVFQEDELNDKIASLEECHSQLLTELANLSSKKCQLLSDSIAVKFSSFQKNTLESTKKDAEIYQAKAGIITAVIDEHISSKTNHIGKAITEVEHYLDDEIRKKDIAT